MSFTSLLLFAVLLPVVAEVCKNVFAVLLASRPAFDDMIDGLTFGVAAGTAYAAFETLVVYSPVFTSQEFRTDEGIASWILVVVNIMVVKSLIYGTATGIAVASFSGKGQGYDGFKPQLLRGLRPRGRRNVAYWVGVRLLAYLPFGNALGLLWGFVILARLIIKIRMMLQAALLEAAVEDAAPGRQHSGSTNSRRTALSARTHAPGRRGVLHRVRHLGALHLPPGAATPRSRPDVRSPPLAASSPPRTRAPGRARTTRWTIPRPTGHRTSPGASDLPRGRQCRRLGRESPRRSPPRRPAAAPPRAGRSPWSSQESSASACWVRSAAWRSAVTVPGPPPRRPPRPPTRRPRVDPTTRLSSPRPLRPAAAERRPAPRARRSAWPASPLPPTSRRRTRTTAPARARASPWTRASTSTYRRAGRLSGTAMLEHAGTYVFAATGVADPSSEASALMQELAPDLLPASTYTQFESSEITPVEPSGSLVSLAFVDYVAVYVDAQSSSRIYGRPTGICGYGVVLAMTIESSPPKAFNNEQPEWTTIPGLTRRRSPGSDLGSGQGVGIPGRPAITALDGHRDVRQASKSPVDREFRGE